MANKRVARLGVVGGINLVFSDVSDQTRLEVPIHAAQRPGSPSPWAVLLADRWSVVELKVFRMATLLHAERSRTRDHRSPHSSVAPVRTERGMHVQLRWCCGWLVGLKWYAAYVDMTSIIHTHAEFGALRVMPPAERSAHRVGCASSMISDR